MTLIGDLCCLDSNALLDSRLGTTSVQEDIVKYLRL